MKSSKKKTKAGIKIYAEQCSASYQDTRSSGHGQAGIRQDVFLRAQYLWLKNYIEKIKKISGIKISDEIFNEMFILLKKVSDKKNYISATDILMILANKGLLKNSIWRLVKVFYKDIEPRSENDFLIVLVIEDQNGDLISIKRSGSDKYETILSLMRSFFHYDIKIIEYTFFDSRESSGIKSVKFHMEAEFEGKFYSDNNSGSEKFELFISSYINIVNLITAIYRFEFASSAAAPSGAAEIF